MPSSTLSGAPIASPTSICLRHRSASGPRSRKAGGDIRCDSQGITAAIRGLACYRVHIRALVAPRRRCSLVRLMFAAALVALGATAVLAEENIIEVRQNLMKRNNDDAKAVSAIAKGAPFDAAAVQKAAADWAEAATKLPTLFPDDS